MAGGFSLLKQIDLTQASRENFQPQRATHIPCHDRFFGSALFLQSKILAANAKETYPFLRMGKCPEERAPTPAGRPVRADLPAHLPSFP
jgi:hypothetical protein